MSFFKVIIDWKCQQHRRQVLFMESFVRFTLLWRERHLLIPICWTGWWYATAYNTSLYRICLTTQCKRGKSMPALQWYNATFEILSFCSILFAVKMSYIVYVTVSLEESWNQKVSKSSSNASIIWRSYLIWLTAKSFHWRHIIYYRI